MRRNQEEVAWEKGTVATMQVAPRHDLGTHMGLQ